MIAMFCRNILIIVLVFIILSSCSFEKKTSVSKFSFPKRQSAKAHMHHGKVVEDMMDVNDKAKMDEVLNFSKRGETQYWYNPETEIAYYVTADEAYYLADESLSVQPCRKYLFKMIFGAQNKEFHRRACRQEDRTWVIQ